MAGRIFGNGNGNTETNWTPEPLEALEWTETKAAEKRRTPNMSPLFGVRCTAALVSIFLLWSGEKQERRKSTAVQVCRLNLEASRNRESSWRLEERKHTRETQFQPLDEAT
jgi:hypothetical protein